MTEATWKKVAFILNSGDTKLDCFNWFNLVLMVFLLVSSLQVAEKRAPAAFSAVGKHAELLISKTCWWKSTGCHKMLLGNGLAFSHIHLKGLH